MNTRRNDPPPSAGRITRRNRGRPKSLDAGGDACVTRAVKDASVFPTETDEPHADQPDSIDSVLAKGHAWLRFPDSLEAQFQADTLEPRRKLLIICGVLGVLSIYLGTLNIAALNPDIAHTALRVAHINVVASALGLVIACAIPKRARRTWQLEALTSLIAIGTCAGLINGCLISSADTTFTHSAVLISVVMYSCIAARLRFRWSLACTILPFLGYAAFVKGFTPLQHLIVIANLKLMALSFIFALLANYTFEYRERHGWLLRKLEEQRRVTLVDTSERLRQLSQKDALTSLFNRRKFNSELEQAWRDAVAARQSIAMLMVDVDFFKRYNDTYGHPLGDACLIKVSEVLARVAQDHAGIAARLGGEEFGLLLPGRTLEQAVCAGNDLRKGVRDAGIEHRASTVASVVTISVGAAQVWPAHDSDPQELVSQADQALYQAKEGGRDRVCAAGDHDMKGEHSTLMPSIGTQEAASAEPVAPADCSSQREKYAETLRSQFRWLSFPPEQEAQYQHHQAEGRRQHLLNMSVLGLVIYLIYMASSRAMFPDVPSNALFVLLGLGILLLTLAVWSYKQTSLTSFMREALFSIGTSVAALMALWMLSQSQQLSALSFATSLALIPLFAGVGARQPFWFTCVPVVMTCLGSILLLKPVGEIQTLVFYDSVLMIVNNAAFTLILAYTLEYGARKNWLLSNVDRLQRQELMAATQRLHELSTQDPLTGIANRRQFDNDLERLSNKCMQEERPLAMLLIDVDFFKFYNDGYGHPAGDACLKVVAATISQVALAAHALPARMGGEEFGILMPGGDIHQILALGEQVCSAMRNAAIEHRYSQVPGHQIVTVSVGAASMMPAKGADRMALIAMADDALYRAKNLGRNRVTAMCAPWDRPTLDGVPSR